MFASPQTPTQPNLMLFTHIKHQFTPCHDLLVGDIAACQRLTIEQHLFYVYIPFSLSLCLDDKFLPILQMQYRPIDGRTA